MPYNRSKILNAMYDDRLREIPIGFLRKGDRFVAQREWTAGGFKQQTVTITGEVHCDGQVVSPDYGYRIHGESLSLEDDRIYVNVRLDGHDYSDPLHPNESLYGREGWTFLVSPKVYYRYLQDQEDYETFVKQTEKERERKKKQDELNRVRTQINKLTEQADALEAELNES